MNVAFLPLSREFFKHCYYRGEKFDRTHAYLDLLQLAEYKEESAPFNIKGRKLTITRGQVAFSMLNLGERWSWDIKSVKKFLNSLRNDGELDYESFPKRNPGITIITLHNYDMLCPPKANSNLANQVDISVKIPSGIPSDIPSDIPSGIPTSNNINNLLTPSNITTIRETELEAKNRMLDDFIYRSN